MSRAEAAGDMRVIAGKGITKGDLAKEPVSALFYVLAMRNKAKMLAARYSSEAEAEVIGWFQDLLGVSLEPGMKNLENQLKNGQLLVKLAEKIRAGTPNVPPKAAKMRLKANTLNAPFKQMENIQVFLTFAENYGVHKNSLFQTVDLFEGRNLAQVLSCIQTLGSETQRLAFNGPTIGPKPTEQNIREFTAEQIAAGKTVIGLQAGTNKCASQKGMAIGSVRHVADIRADEMDKAGQAVLSGQTGYAGGASQSGMNMGGVRHVADIRADDLDKAGQSVLSGQTGFAGGASQAGMSMGAVRHVSDIRADDASKEGASVLGGQMGFTGGASQAGMSMGSVRHVSDIRADDMDKAGQGIVGGQMGFTGGASQKGMAIGSVRHVADIRADDALRSSDVGLQMGTNKMASQSGMAMGGIRHVADMKTGEASKEGSSVIGLQMGQTSGATQQGMSYGGRRDITKK